MTQADLQEWMIQNRLADSWRVAVENEPTPREEIFTLNEAAGLLVECGWKIMVVNVADSAEDAKSWASLELPPKPAPKILASQVEYRPPPIPLSEKSNDFKTRAGYLSAFGIILLIVGALMVADGVVAQMAEATAPESSAIRGIENVAEYGLGFVVVALSMMLFGVSGLLVKK